MVHVIDLLQQSLRHEPLDLRVLLRQPLVFPETLPLLPALEQFRHARTISPLWWMSLVPLRGGDPERCHGNHHAGNLPNEAEEIDARHDIAKKS